MSKILVVDLTKQKASTETLSADIMEKFLGGRGLGAYLLYTKLEKGVDPLSEDNLLIFSCGPLQGTSTYYNSRATLNTKSPLTGNYLYSVAGGRFGHQIKKAGYTAVIIKGRSTEPVYVAIKDDKIDIKPAGKFWGLDTIATQEALLSDAGMPKGSCVCIGPAGENLHKMAIIATEGSKLRTFGRGGCGAVMGSKNLKGIVVSGTQKVTIADQDAFEECKRIVRENVKNNPKWAEQKRHFGTGGDILSVNELGVLPTRNWQEGSFKEIKSIAPTELAGIWPSKNVSCGPNCLNPCGRFVHIDKGPRRGAKTEGPEYETIYAFGPNCGVNEFDAIVAAEQICDEYGIDTISCGVTAGFAMECFERGLISREETGGIELRFGDADALIKLVEMIAKKEGIGKIFGEGVRSASEKIAGSKSFAMHCKGLEFGGYECRGMWGQALQYALNPRGGCHHGLGLPARSPSDQGNGDSLTGKGDLVKNGGIYRILFDCLILCSFTRPMENDILDQIVNSVTGKNYTINELQKIALRVLNLERMFNVREGLRRSDDFLPGRLTQEPLLVGPRKGSVVPMDELLDEGYRALGWEKETGIPTKETLAELGLAEICL